MLQILTWNINGIRSCHNSKSLKSLLDSLEADIICFQETKITRDQLDESIAFVEGYSSYFSFSRKRAGYSGVATYCKDRVTPTKAEEGLTGYLVPQAELGCVSKLTGEFSDSLLRDIDSEGRCVITLHTVKNGDKTFPVAVFNVYCPRADWDNPVRVDFKLNFYRIMQLRCEELLGQGYRVVVVGDVNTSHRPIDHCEPDDIENFGKRPDRQWLDAFLYNGENDGKFLDAFRVLYPTREKCFTCWDTLLNARANNYGSRIDYVLISRDLGAFLTECQILVDVYGSDHCPVKATFDLEPEPSLKCPAFCTKFYKEFSGKQQKLSQFVIKRKMEETVSVQTVTQRDVKKVRLLATQSKQKSLFNYFSKKEDRVEAKEAVSLSTAVESQLLNESSDDLPDALTSESGTCNQSSQQQQLWKSLFKGPPEAPKCRGHGEPCVLRTVKKKGPNMNRQFWVCARAAGHSTDPEAKCNFFSWVKK